MLAIPDAAQGAPTSTDLRSAHNERTHYHLRIITQHCKAIELVFEPTSLLLVSINLLGVNATTAK